MTIYETSKHFIKKETKKEFQNYIGSLVGVFSKISTSFLLYPFNLIRSKQQQINTQKVHLDDKLIKNSIITNKDYGYFSNTIKIIYSEQGLSGFYHGLSPLLIRQVPHSVIFFYTYEYVLKYINKY